MEVEVTPGIVELLPRSCSRLSLPCKVMRKGNSKRGGEEQGGVKKSCWKEGEQAGEGEVINHCSC